MKKSLMKITLTSLTMIVIGTSGMTFANESMKNKTASPEAEKPKMEMMAQASTNRMEIEGTLDLLNAEKVALHKTLTDLETQHHAAKEIGDQALMTSLETSIQSIKDEITLKHEAIDAAMGSLKKAVHKEFSSDVIMKNMKLKAEFAKNLPSVQVLELETIIAKGHKFNFNAPPVMKGENILMPVRAMAEAVGAELTWDAATKTATLTKASKIIKIHLDTNEVHVDGVKVEMTEAAFSMKGNMYVPLHFIANEFGFDVTWHKALKIAELTHKAPVTTPVTEESKAASEETTDEAHQH